MQTMKQQAEQMIQTIIAENLPEPSTIKALESHDFAGKQVVLVAIGKAAWRMAKAAKDHLGDAITQGIVITKYDHSAGPIDGLRIYEAGHPTLDQNTIDATQQVVELVSELSSEHLVLFLVSGGGSALFEAPKAGITLEMLQSLTNQLLASGADIVEINTVRKRLSQVKAGGFAQMVAPAQVFAVVLSDVLGDRLDSIASGPAAPDLTTVADVLAIVDKYNLDLPEQARAYLQEETPKTLDNVKTIITGSVSSLVASAANTAQSLGYKPYVLTTTLACEAREAGRFMGTIATATDKGETSFEKPAAIIAGGETVVTLTGKGKGGRNQEIALSSAKHLAGMDNALLFSLGSDGTDGPTDAAGGMVDGNTLAQLKAKGLSLDDILANNDAYHGLQAVDGLIMTGPTGTNVNDVAVLLIS